MRQPYDRVYFIPPKSGTMNLATVHAINLKRLSDDTLGLAGRDTLESWALWCVT
jgi:hypothetical protein